MDWADIIEKRHTTFAWEENTIPTKGLIVEAIEEVYTHIPSKNLQFPYQVRLLRNNDINIQKEIMTICHRNKEMDIQEDRGNPQVLAPWLLGFNARWVGDLEKRYETTSKRGDLDGIGIGQKRTSDPVGQTQSENIEIGIFCAYIMLALTNRGIQSGMCQNICRNYKRAEEIFEIGKDERSLDFRFIMGIGYAKDRNLRHDYFDPRINKNKPIPYAPIDVHKVYPRPDMNDIVKIIKE